MSGSEKQRKVIGIFIFFTICFMVTVGNVFADKDIQVVINGEPMYSEVSPILDNARVLVPLRAISESFRYAVSWDSKTKTVRIRSKNDLLEIPANKNIYKKNGKQKKSDVAPKLKNGVVFVPLRMIAEEFGCEVQWKKAENKVVIQSYRVVEVADELSFLKNIGSDTKLILTGKEYVLSNVMGVSNPNIKSIDVFDGQEHVIKGVENLEIVAKPGTKPVLLVRPRYSDVLSFEDCSNITIRGVKAGHTVESGSCTGGVFDFRNTKKVLIKNCRLYGCGTYGVTGQNSESIKVLNTEIYECTYGCVSFESCKDISFASCVFKDSQEFSMFEFSNTSNVLIRDSHIRNNRSTERWPFIYALGSQNIEFARCKFYGNSYDILKYEDAVKFRDCYIED